MRFVVSVIGLVVIYSSCARSAVWLSRRLGLLSLTHGAIMGCGAYSFALCSKAGIPLIPSVFLGILTSGISGCILMITSDSVQAEDFALVSFGVQVIWLVCARNMTWLTRGALGIPGVPELVKLPLEDYGLGAALFYCCLSLVAATIFSRVDRSPFSIASSVVKSSKELALSIGLSGRLIRAQIGFLYGLTVGLFAICLASTLTFISPDQFSIDTSVTIVAIAFLMREDNLLSAISASGLLIGIPQVLRLAGVSTARSGFIQLFLGGLIVAFGALAVTTAQRGRHD